MNILKDLVRNEGRWRKAQKSLPLTNEKKPHPIDVQHRVIFKHFQTRHQDKSEQSPKQ